MLDPQPAHHLVQQKVRGAADNNIVLPLYLGVPGLNLVHVAVPKLHHIFLNVLYLNIISFQEGCIRLQRLGHGKQVKGILKGDHQQFWHIAPNPWVCAHIVEDKVYQRLAVVDGIIKIVHIHKHIPFW